MAAPQPALATLANEKTVMIQIRNVPDPVHRRLKAKAALEGLTLSDFLLREVRHLAERPAVTELAERILSTERVATSVSVSDMVRRERPE